MNIDGKVSRLLAVISDLTAERAELVATAMGMQGELKAALEKADFMGKTTDALHKELDKYNHLPEAPNERKTPDGEGKDEPGNSTTNFTPA